MPQGENVRICDEIDTPFVLGTLCPKIYLPSDLEEEQAVYVLAHERAHIARGDHWWKPLGWLLLSVYWFQPVLWLAYILFCRDLELACDERVAASLDRDGLAAYSDALLQCSVRRGALASPVAFGETGVKVRVRAILRYRKPALRVVLTALLCVVIVGALFLTERPAVAAKITQIILPEIQPLQCIGHKRRGKQRAEGADKCDKEGIQEEGSKSVAHKALPAAGIVIQRPHRRDQLACGRKNIIRRLEGAQHHPEQGINHDDAADGHQNMIDDFFPKLFFCFHTSPSSQAS